VRYNQFDAGSLTLRSHALTYKVDLDINGEANSLAKHSVIATEKAYPWSNGKTRSTFELQRSYIETEDNSKINWPENAQSMYIVENKEEVNPYGEPRGYRIFPNSMATHLPLQKSSNLKNAQSFATHHLYATKHHDNEQHCRPFRVERGTLTTIRRFECP
jgi:primary-amine oxidase